MGKQLIKRLKQKDDYDMDIVKMTTDLWMVFLKDNEGEEDYYSQLTFRVWNEVDYNLTLEEERRMLQTLIALNEKVEYNKKQSTIDYLQGHLERLKNK